MSTYSREWNLRVPFRHSRYLPERSLCLAVCPLRHRQGQNPVRSDLDHSAVTPQSSTFQHDEMARPSWRVEGIRPDQNPAGDLLDGVKPGVLNLVVLFYSPGSSPQRTIEANESSRRCAARPIRVVDVSPGELYSVENPHPHQRYQR
jgi:hypothetical protein